MRWLAGLLVVAGCAPVWEPPHRPGADRRPHDTRPIELTCDDEDVCAGRRHDVVTRPGGDPTDWFTLDLPRTTCGGSYAVLKVHNAPARPGMFVQVVVYDERLREVSRRVRVKDRVARLSFPYLAGGRYYVRVSASSRGAGAYELLVMASQTSGCGGEHILTRPDDATTPPTTLPAVLAPIAEAGAGANAPPSVVVDASDPRVRPGMRGVVLDERGAPIRHSDLVIDERFTRGEMTLAVGRFTRPGDMRRRMQLGWTGWTIALQRADR